ncbi:MAG: SH3 domain-containing protein [Pyrinomonadaceae bacterium]
MVIKPSFIVLSTVVLVCLATTCNAQLKRPALVKSKAVNTVARSHEIGQSAVVVDETLSVLREKPSLFSDSVQRMRRGRTIQILGVTEADGVKFYKVTAPPKNYGWVQADAVFGKFRAADEERLARLVQASDGFEQIEIAHEFFNLYPQSKFRPAILLLYGDLLEEAAVKLSKDAGSRLSRKEMAASAAPMHSYFLNFNMLDRYRKLGVIFVFNPNTRLFHYDGGGWREIAAKFSTASEAAEAQKRLESLRVKMSAIPAVRAK